MPATAYQGYSVDASNPDALRHAVELAIDYRGDVTITRHSNPQPIVGYVFDRTAPRTAPHVAPHAAPSAFDRAADDVVLRMIPADGSERINIPLGDISRIEFTGRDTASGKSFETWVKNYIEKKRAGERASIESDPLTDADDDPRVAPADRST